MTMDSWYDYERKRIRFEQKYRPRIKKVLKQQLALYIQNQEHQINFADMLTVLVDLYKDAGGYFGRQQYRELRAEAGRKFLGIGFNADFARDVMEHLRMNGLRLAQNMSETTRQLILKLLIQAQEENLSVPDTVRLIVREVEEVIAYRARRIVRTEVGRAANLGKLAAAAQMGLMMDKNWVTARDERVRRKPRDKADHLVLNGNSVELDKPFANGLMLPGDETALPEETINCRCTITFKVKRDRNGMTIPKTYIL